MNTPKLIPWLLAALCCAATGAQAAAAVPDAALLEGVQPVGLIGTASGTGGQPAVAEAVADMRNNTLFHPLKMPPGQLPLLLWGEGGCSDNGLGYGPFLREIASHGYFVIAGGYPREERPVHPPGTTAPPPPPGGMAGAQRDTEVSELLDAIDWAKRQQADPASPFHGHIDTARIGVMGHSCGGLQAISVATDPRVRTAIAFNSGVIKDIKALPSGMKKNANLVVGKEALRELKGPIAYINGGPTDIAYQNAEDDFRLIEHVPVFFAENGVGHGGTYSYDANGGEYAQVAVAWMDWQLKGDARAAHWFRGADCVLCTRPGWAVRKKRIDAE